MIDGGFDGATVVVVGAGAVGSATAYRVAKAGGNVTIVDASYPGSGTSGNSFAWLNSFNKRPKAYYRLNHRSIQDHRDLQEEVGGHWATVNGALHWATVDDVGEVERLQETIRRLDSWGSRIEKVTPEEATRNLEPDLVLDRERVDAVYYLPSEGWVQPYELVSSLLGAARERYGLRFLRGQVTGLARDGNTATGVTLADGTTIGADIVIITSGATAGAFLAETGSPATIQQIPGSLAVLAPVPARIRHVLRGPKDLCVRPDGGQRLLVSWGATLSLTDGDRPTLASVSEERYAGLAAYVAEWIPLATGVPIEAIRYGIRPMPDDGHPIIGPDPEVSGVYFAVMHSGITLSARVSELIVTDLLRPEGSDELADYRPDRFADGKVRAVMATDE